MKKAFDGNSLWVSLKKKWAAAKLDPNSFSVQILLVR